MNHIDISSDLEEDSDLEENFEELVKEAQLQMKKFSTTKYKSHR